MRGLGQSPKRFPRSSWISRFHVRATGMGDKKRIIACPSAKQMESGRCRELSSLPGDWGQSPKRFPERSWIFRFYVRTTDMGDKKRIISMPICEADGERKVQGTQFPAGGLGAEPPTCPQSSWISRFHVRTTGMGDKKRIIACPSAKQMGSGRCRELSSLPGDWGQNPQRNPRKKGTYVFSRSMA